MFSLVKGAAARIALQVVRHLIEMGIEKVVEMERYAEIIAGIAPSASLGRISGTR